MVRRSQAVGGVAYDSWDPRSACQARGESAAVVAYLGNHMMGVLISSCVKQLSRFTNLDGVVNCQNVAVLVMPTSNACVNPRGHLGHSRVISKHNHCETSNVMPINK